MKAAGDIGVSSNDESSSEKAKTLRFDALRTGREETRTGAGARRTSVLSERLTSALRCAADRLAHLSFMP